VCRNAFQDHRKLYEREADGPGPADIIVWNEDPIMDNTGTVINIDRCTSKRTSLLDAPLVYSSMAVRVLTAGHQFENEGTTGMTNADYTPASEGTWLLCHPHFPFPVHYCDFKRNSITSDCYLYLLRL
jgi:hypothetical protein